MASTITGGTATGVSSGPWLSSSSDRQFPDALFEAMIVALGGGEGVLEGSGSGGTELEVTPTSPTAMQVTVDVGAAILGPVDDGMRIARVTSEQTVQISPADASNPRVDVLGFRARDSTYSNSNDGRAAGLYVLPGTPAALPVPRTFSTSSRQRFLPLARLDVGANATSIAASDITDLRHFVGGACRTSGPRERRYRRRRTKATCICSRQTWRAGWTGRTRTARLTLTSAERACGCGQLRRDGLGQAKQAISS